MRATTSYGRRILVTSYTWSFSLVRSSRPFPPQQKGQVPPLGGKGSATPDYVFARSVSIPPPVLAYPLRNISSRQLHFRSIFTPVCPFTSPSRNYLSMLISVVFSYADIMMKAFVVEMLCTKTSYSWYAIGTQMLAAWRVNFIVQ